MFAKAGGSGMGIETILAKLLAIDGPGSGLDADLLDGYQASAFLRLAAGGTMTADLAFAIGKTLTTPNLTIPNTGTGGGLDIQAPMKYDGTEILRFSALGITLIDPDTWETGQGNSPILNLAGWDITNINTANFESTGAGQGLLWTASANGWSLDVSPLTRTTVDGNFNIYGTGGNIALWRPLLFVYDNDTYITANCDSAGILQVSGAVTLADLLTIPQMLSTGDVSLQTDSGTDAIFTIQSGDGALWKIQQKDGTDELRVTVGDETETEILVLSSDGSITTAGTVNGRDMAADGAVIDEIPNTITTNEALRDETEALRDETATLTENTFGYKTAAETARNEAQESATSAASYLTSVAEAGTTQVMAVQAAGAIQVSNVNTAGATQVAAVQAETTAQLATLAIRATTLGMNQGIRQTVLETPELAAADDSETLIPDVVCAKTCLAPAVSSVTIDGPDMLTGSKGGMALLMSTNSLDHKFMFSNIFGDGYDYTMACPDMGAFVTGEDYIRAMLTTGVEFGGNTNIPDTTVLLQMTTHKKNIDGIEWHYNPTTGFAMCKYDGNGGTTFTLNHPMGKKPMIFHIKNLAAESNWVVGFSEAFKTMYLNRPGAMILDYAGFFPVAQTAHTITLGETTWVNASATGHIFWGYFGDELDDLYAGMTGERGSTALFEIPANSGVIEIDTGVESIEAIFQKPTDLSGDWFYRDVSLGWDMCIDCGTLAEPLADTSFTVDGSKITFNNFPICSMLFHIIGKTMSPPNTNLNQATQVVIKKGNATSGHEIHLGHDFVTGDNGGMVFGRNITAACPGFVMDTLGTGAGHLVMNESYVHDSSTIILEEWTTNGIKVSSHAYINATTFNQFHAFGTTHKITHGGLEWQYNPGTGFAMTEFLGDGVLGRTIEHPMGKVPINMWFKGKNVVIPWVTYSHTWGNTQYGLLSDPAAIATGTGAWNDTDPTETTITLGNGGGVNEDGATYKLYMWVGESLDAGMGIEGVSFVGSCTLAASGYTAIDTQIEDIEMILIKETTGSAGWYLVVKDSRFGIWYALSDAIAAATNLTWITVEGSQILVKLGYEVEATVFAWGSKVEGGKEANIQIPASADYPFTASIAQGYDEQGQNDLIIQKTSPINIASPGTEGTAYIYMDAAGTLNTTYERPTYVRGGNLNIAWCYDIDRGRMYYDRVETPVIFIGQCKVDPSGNVYGFQTYAPRDIWISDEFYAGPLTTYDFPLPWGHKEVRLIATSTDYESTNPAEATEQWKVDANGINCGSQALIYDDSIAIYTGEQPSFRRAGNIHYRLKARRNF